MSAEKKDNGLQDEKDQVVPEAEAQEEANATETEEPAVDLEQELASAKEEVADLKDKMLRLVAESENFKKRMERERSTALKYSGEQIFREMLPVVDNLERAIAHCDEAANGDVDANFKGLLEGVQLTLKSLVGILEKFEVKPISSVGEPFDPNQQEALTMEASDEIPANHVAGEFEKGYFYKDRLLRAAKVIVSSGPKG